MSTWQDQRAMTPLEYVGAMRVLGLDQAKTARLLGISERTSRRYVRGETEIPPAQVLLLRAMLRYRVTPVVPDWHAEQN
jgi:DNA-binding transcriptional regulator YdaS (Cro superfamily)